MMRLTASLMLIRSLPERLLIPLFCFHAQHPHIIWTPGLDWRVGWRSGGRAIYVICFINGGGGPQYLRDEGLVLKKCLGLGLLSFLTVLSLP